MSVRFEVSEIILQSFNTGLLKKLVFSKAEDGYPTKITAKLCSVGGKTVVSFEKEFPFGRVEQVNLNKNGAAEYADKLFDGYMQINIITAVGDAEYKRSSKGKELFNGKRLSFLMETSLLKPEISDIQHKKNYALTGSEPFLISLGISDANGRVHDKKQGKFRQLNHFTEQLENIYSAFSGKDIIKIYDLCCGKSYLSFAVYHYFKNIKNRQISMLCIDQRAEVISFCRDIAEKSGFDEMTFVCDDVRNTPKDSCPDLVISLHACDIATDIVLDSAIASGAEVILSTPCCHRYLNSKINSPPLSFVTDFPHLRNKLCEAITDAIRLIRLKKNGYSVSALEFTDPENTPKNTLIRAVKRKSFNINSPEAKRLNDEYDAVLSFVLGESKDTYLKEIEKQ